jgi:hypothetical protein
MSFLQHFPGIAPRTREGEKGDHPVWEHYPAPNWSLRERRKGIPAVGQQTHEAAHFSFRVQQKPVLRVAIQAVY